MENKEKKERGQLVAPEKTVIVSLLDDNVYTPIGQASEEGASPDFIKTMETVGQYEYKGKVLAVGSGLTGVEVGDILHHGKHAGIVWTFNGENLSTIREYEFCAIEKQS